jgi:hypothetical protein
MTAKHRQWALLIALVGMIALTAWNANVRNIVSNIIDPSRTSTPVMWKPPEGFALSPETKILPNLGGYGCLKDLSASAMTDPALLALIKDYIALSDHADAGKLVSEFDALLYAWAGVDKIERHSRGTLVDARKLGFLAKFYNDGFYDSGIISSKGQADLDNYTYNLIRDGLLTRFLAGIPPYIWLTTRDEKKAYASRFMPLMELGLAADNQFKGDLQNALSRVFKSMPEDDAEARFYLDVMIAALAGVINEPAKENREAFETEVLLAIAWGLRQNVARVDIVAEKILATKLRHVGGANSASAAQRNDLYLWTGGDVSIDETSDTSGAADKLLLPGVRTNKVSFVMTDQDITLVIAPSDEGETDGGNIKLLKLDEKSKRGVETIILSDNIWTHAEMRAKALAASRADGKK